MFICSLSIRGITEKAPETYKDVRQVAEITHQAGLSYKVAELASIINSKFSSATHMY